MLPQLGGIDLVAHPVNRFAVAVVRHAHDEPAAGWQVRAGWVIRHAGELQNF
jgi:hypothetical protein